MNVNRVVHRQNSRFCLSLKAEGDFFVYERDQQKERRTKVNLSFCQKLINQHDTVFADRIKNHLDTMERNGDKRLQVSRNWQS